MFETDVTIRGRLVGDPTSRVTTAGLPVTSFRVAATERRPAPDSSGGWTEGPPSYYGVSAWRQLGLNCAASLKKGQPVVIRGRQRVVTYTKADGTTGVDVQIDANVVGHDLLLGTTTFEKSVRRSHQSSDDRMNSIPDFQHPGHEDGLPDPATEPFDLETADGQVVGSESLAQSGFDRSGRESESSAT